MSILFKKMSVEDFAVLRGPLESGRQSPDSFGAIFWLGIILQALLIYLIYSVPDSTIYPNIEVIREVHLWITATLSVLCIIYSVPFIYKRSQNVQYLLSILLSQNFGGACMYLGAIFFIGELPNVTEEFLIQLTYITLFIAFAFFIVTFVRFYILLQKGKFRSESTRQQLRNSFETTSYMPYIIGGTFGLIYFSAFLMSILGWYGFDTFNLTVIPLLIFYAMVFVLPEQIVILYCKCRFKSFNFDRNGYLYSEPTNTATKKVINSGHISAKRE